MSQQQLTHKSVVQKLLLNFTHAIQLHADPYGRSSVEIVGSKPAVSSRATVGRSPVHTK
jgi:hypothetical protein